MLTKDLKYIIEMFSDVVKINNLRPVTSFVEMFCKDGIFRIGSEIYGVGWGFKCWG